MNKSEIMEIKKLYGIKNCSVTRIAGCYIDAEKNIIAKFNESFLTRPEEEIFKYLEIFKKGLSGGIGKNIRTLDISESEIKKSLNAIVKSELVPGKSAMTDTFFEAIINHYHKVENCLILLMHNAYDVPGKGVDGLKDGESDEVYSYITCYICPMKIEKPGLAYNKDTSMIEKKELRWCVNAPEFSFIYPSFEERASDYEKVTVYTKSTGDEYNGVIENFLGCTYNLTAETQKNIFQEVIEESLSESTSEEKLEIVKNISQYIAGKIEEDGKDTSFDAEDIKQLLKSNHAGIENVDEKMGDNRLSAEVILPKKMEVELPGIVVKINTEETNRFTRKIIDGEEYLLIATKNNSITVNGILVD